MKTDERGFYKFYTLGPGHYPNTNIPAHTHILKQRDKNEYYIDEYLFEGDSFFDRVREKQAGKTRRQRNHINAKQERYIVRNKKYCVGAEHSWLLRRGRKNLVRKEAPRNKRPISVI